MATGSCPQAGLDSSLPLRAKTPTASPLVTWRKASETSQVTLSRSKENQSPPVGTPLVPGGILSGLSAQSYCPVPVLTLRSLNATHDCVFAACIGN